MNIRLMFGTVLFMAALLPIQAQTTESVSGQVRTPQTIEERVSNEFKEKQLRKEAEEKLAAEQSNRIANMRPTALLSQGRTIYINSDTSFFEEAQLQNALRKRTEFKDWQLTIIDGRDNRTTMNADLWIEIDRPLFTYNFTYQIIHRRTGIVLATGKVTAFDGNIAAPKLAARIIEDIKQARGVATNQPSQRMTDKEPSIDYDLIKGAVIPELHHEKRSDRMLKAQLQVQEQ